MLEANMTSVWPDGQEQRRRNRLIVEDYMSRTGEARLSRFELFNADGSGGLWTNDTCKPIVSVGREALRAHGVWSLQCFPDWRWFNIEIFETQDPDRFWVECDGEGRIQFPGYEAGFYKNHFIHSFLFENGKIKQNREFMNPYEQMRALGIPWESIKREGIP